MDDELKKSVKNSLKNSRYGKLQYDRYWEEEGRGRGIANDINERLCSLHVPPKENGLINQNHSLPRFNSSKIDDVNYCHSKSSNNYVYSYSSRPPVDPINSYFKQSPPHSSNQDVTSNHANNKSDPLDLSRNLGEKSTFQVSDFLYKLKEIQEDSKKSPTGPKPSSRISSLSDEIDVLTEFLNSEGSLVETSDINQKLNQVQQKSQKVKEEQVARKALQQELKNKIDQSIRNTLNHLTECKRNTKEYTDFMNDCQAEFISFNKQIGHLTNLSQPNDQEINSLKRLNDEVTVSCYSVIDSASKLSEKIDEEIAAKAKAVAEAKAVQAEKEAELIREKEKQQLQQTASSSNNNKQEEKFHVTSTQLTLPKAPVKSLDQFSSSPESLFFHKQIELKQFEESIKPFTQDDSQKAYRSDLTLFLKININNIATGSNDLLRQKFRILCNLFDGQNVPFRNSTINCQRHPLALKFCYLTAVNTFIAATPKQLIDVPQAAFSLSAVITLLWCHHEQFGELFLAVLYKKCPYVVGYYPERQTDDTDATYMELCGYTFTGGKVESEESFLNRMRSFVKLYAGIVQSTPQMNHPHALQFGWCLLARTLNIEPIPGVTPAVLYAFLSVATYKMTLLYKRQFVKMLNFIQKDYLGRIELKSTSSDKKPSLEQLRLLIKDLVKKVNSGKVNEIKPQGIMPDYFWQNSYINSR